MSGARCVAVGQTFVLRQSRRLALGGGGGGPSGKCSQPSLAARVGVLGLARAEGVVADHRGEVDVQLRQVGQLARGLLAGLLARGRRPSRRLDVPAEGLRAADAVLEAVEVAHEVEAGVEQRAVGGGRAERARRAELHEEAVAARRRPVVESAGPWAEGRGVPSRKVERVFLQTLRVGRRRVECVQAVGGAAQLSVDRSERCHDESAHFTNCYSNLRCNRRESREASRLDLRPLDEPHVPNPRLSAAMKLFSCEGRSRGLS